MVPLPLAILICPTTKVALICGFDKRRYLKINKLPEVAARKLVVIPSIYPAAARGIVVKDVIEKFQLPLFPILNNLYGP